MDNFATIDSVRTLGNITQVDEEKITPHLFTAQIDVTKSITKEKYEEVLAEVDTDDYKKVQQAESYFVLSYLIPVINISSTGNGIVKSTGTGEGRTEMLSENDVETIIQRYRDNAEKLLQEFIPEVDYDEDDNNDRVSTPNVKMIAV